MQTLLEVADNSGAKKVMCIKVLGGSGKMTANIGDIIVVSVKEALPRTKVKKGDVYKGVIIRTKSGLHRFDGSRLQFDQNAIVLLNKQGEPMGTRVLGVVPRELRKKNFTKILSLAEEVL